MRVSQVGKGSEQGNHGGFFSNRALVLHGGHHRGPKQAFEDQLRVLVVEIPLAGKLLDQGGYDGLCLGVRDEQTRALARNLEQGICTGEQDARERRIPSQPVGCDHIVAEPHLPARSNTTRLGLRTQHDRRGVRSLAEELEKVVAQTKRRRRNRIGPQGRVVL